MKIIEEIKDIIGKNSIEKIEFEGSKIIVYVSNKEIVENQENYIKEIVEKFKKRVEIRATKDILISEEDAKNKILEIAPPDSKVIDFYFDKNNSIVYISAEKPGLLIGKGAETLKKIKKEIFWTPRVERVPALKSPIIESIRKIFLAEQDFRNDFLNKVGEKIFQEINQKRDWIRIIPLGGYREVGRSCSLVETPKSKILIDCGINVGGTANNFYPIFNTSEFDFNNIDAIVVSHAHLDHVGAIPALYERGYDGPLYMTEPTLHLATLLWLDYIDVMQKSGIQSIYTIKGVKEAVRRAITLRYEEVCDITNDVKLTFYNAGHILGSAIVHLHVGEGLHNIVYALDQKFDRTRLLDPAHFQFQRIETLIIETTYGGIEDIMKKRSETEKELLEIINKTMNRNGIVLIPTFSVERAQEIMAILFENNFQYPIYLDGMIWEANEIFSAYPEYFGKSMRKKILIENKNPFTWENFKRITSNQDREKAWNDKPCIIMSTSGMLVGGPVISHLVNLAEDEKNTIIFVGYQGVNTLGRRIQRGEKEVLLNYENKQINLKINMEVYSTNGLSGHSDRRQLLAYIGNLTAKPKRVICCHGEANKSIEFARAVNKLFKIEAISPQNLESIRLL